MRILSVITLGLAAVALAAGTATGAAAKSSGFFKTQNGKIYCMWGTGVRGFVVCGIRNGHLKPKPTKKCRIGDPTGGWLGFNTRGGRRSSPVQAMPDHLPIRHTRKCGRRVQRGGAAGCRARSRPRPLPAGTSLSTASPSPPLGRTRLSRTAHFRGTGPMAALWGLRIEADPSVTPPLLPASAPASSPPASAPCGAGTCRP